MRAPVFADAEPVSLDEEESGRLAAYVTDLYDNGIIARNAWESKHQVYDDMFRGKTQDRVGPWEGAADLHVQMPYWLTDAVNVRLGASIWNQVPLIGGKAEEEDDQQAFRNATKLVEWDFQPKRMNARAMWSRVSKIRLIHGVGTGLLSYADDKHTYRTKTKEPRFNEESDEVEEVDVVEEVETTLYSGPVLTPLDWDDVVAPLNCMNLQPNRPSNPRGAEWVILRQWEPLSLMWAKKESSYPDLDGDKADWVDVAPSQDRSSTGKSGKNNRAVRNQDRHEGRNRTRETRDNPTDKPNPEFEILTYFGVWEFDGKEEEVVAFVVSDPQTTIGVWRLSDLFYRGKRPLLDLHYQTVGTRYYSMGIMEIVQHLSAELDTIHNMRLDVGQATNLPFFFYRSTSSFEPSEIKIKPFKGIPVDQPQTDVYFPQMQNVTSFYHQEEVLLYTLVERVVGVTDLFLGMSPTRGAAARHATGFIGTQQESLARTSEILNQDAEAFSFLCEFTHDLEMQYGPDFRSFRLQGERGAQTYRLNRDDLWMRGEYDMRLGANQGHFSSWVRQQQGQAVLQLAQASPFINQDMGRRWNAESDYLHSVGIPDPERYLGPYDAVSMGSPKRPDEEAAQMDQSFYGPSAPAPVHPSDNDQEHIQVETEHLNDPLFIRMGRPNLEGHLAHLELHRRQMMQKQQMADQQQMMATSEGVPGQSPQGQSSGDRAMAQLFDMGPVATTGQSPMPGANSGQPG